MRVCARFGKLTSERILCVISFIWVGVGNAQGAESITILPRLRAGDLIGSTVSAILISSALLLMAVWCFGIRECKGQHMKCACCGEKSTNSVCDACYQRALDEAKRATK